jgi:hypothetical protein
MNPNFSELGLTRASGRAVPRGMPGKVQNWHCGGFRIASVAGDELRDKVRKTVRFQGTPPVSNMRRELARGGAPS